MKIVKIVIERLKEDKHLPILVEGLPVERSHLKYRATNGSTRFYGYVLPGHNIVLALQETNWYIAGVKPYYCRLLRFHNFKPSIKDVEAVGEVPTDQLLERISCHANREERLAELFDSKPTIRKVRSLMTLVNEARDNRHSLYIDAIKEYYDL